MAVDAARDVPVTARRATSGEPQFAGPDHARGRVHERDTPPRHSSLVTSTFRLTQRGLRRVGLDLTRSSFYSPIPNLEELPSPNRRSAMSGIQMREDRQVDFLRSASHWFAEYARNVHVRANRQFGPVDSELLYMMIRSGKPRQVMEYGAGYSTLVAAAACEANRRDGAETRLISHDPYPREFLTDSNVPGLAEFHRVGVDRQMIKDVATLESGDLLFVDTTHTVKIGGDVNTIILDVLPELKPGVIVHFHDIFLPWDYPRAWIEQGYYWAEQYLLQAFLSGNPEWDILVSAYVLSRTAVSELQQLIPSFRPDTRPASFWMRKRTSRPA